MLFGIGVTLSLIASCVVLLYLYFIWNFNYWKKRGIIGPKPKAVLGNYPNILTRSRHIVYDIHDIYQEYKNRSGFIGVFMIRNPQLLITDPAIARKILTTEFKSFATNEAARWTDLINEKSLTLNPFMLSGEKWKEKRNDQVQGLTPIRIKAVYPIMLDVCNQMEKYLEKVTAGNRNNGLDVKDLSSKFTLGVVSNSIYGVESGVFESEKCIIYDMGVGAMKELMSTFMYFFVLSVLPVLKFVYKPPVLKKKYKDFFSDIMEKSIEMRRKSKIDRMDFLNHIIQLSDKKNLSEDEKLALTLSFFLDGFDTTSVVITHTLHMLAKHPAIQQRLREELLDASNEAGQIEFEKLVELPFLDQCIQESLRMFPPGVFISKLCTEPVTLTDSKDKSIHLYPDEIVTLPIFSLHYDERYYDNPKEFNPERFNPEYGGTKRYSDMGVFMPFGDGPRICLGRRLALAQIKVGTASIIKNWDLTVNNKTKKEFVVDPNVFLCMWKGGIYINFNKLN